MQFKVKYSSIFHDKDAIGVFIQIPNFSYPFCSLSRYILVARVTDVSGEMYLSLFNDEAERVLGCSADELDKLKSQVHLYNSIQCAYYS